MAIDIQKYLVIFFNFTNQQRSSSTFRLVYEDKAHSSWLLWYEDKAFPKYTIIKGVSRGICHT